MKRRIVELTPEQLAAVKHMAGDVPTDEELRELAGHFGVNVDSIRYALGLPLEPRPSSRFPSSSTTVLAAEPEEQNPESITDEERERRGRAKFERDIRKWAGKTTTHVNRRTGLVYGTTKNVNDTERPRVFGTFGVR